MKVYLTKYALTDGIIEVEQERFPDENKRNVFANFEDAVKRVEAMRDMRIHSLANQIEQLKLRDCRKLVKWED